MATYRNLCQKQALATHWMRFQPGLLRQRVQTSYLRQRHASVWFLPGYLPRLRQ